ncbi:MAG: YihA family ribosome biogenesis GTP-binding protein [Clostridiaceae bacterium]|nr:YihA family ribosome biogenesis GTP-binding protein [Clostridiaceae bacterium]
MKINYQNAKLAQVAGFKEQFPQDDLPQIAISGKSNVGKSSLINALCQNSKLARTGKSPGKTRQVIFFNIDDKFYLVDLPGYGYAKTSQKEIEKFSELTDTYISTQTIHMVVQLIDIRHKPTLNDLNMINWLAHSGIPYLIALTKADKLKKSQINKQVELIRKKLYENLQENFNPIIISSVKKQGLDQLKSAIETVLTGE